MSLPERASGSCLCGAVRFTASLPSLVCAHCHCSMCRRNHGAGYVTWFAVPRAQLVIESGAERARSLRVVRARKPFVLPPLRKLALLRIDPASRSHRHRARRDAGADRSRAPAPHLLRLSRVVDRDRRRPAAARRKDRPRAVAGRAEGGRGRMSDACCEASAQSASALAARHRGVLWTVLAINLGLFAVEVVAGLRAGSSALLGDSLDMLGDALVYAASLYVVGRSARAQARVAVGKGLLMGALAASVVADALARIAEPGAAVERDRRRGGRARARRERRVLRAPLPPPRRQPELSLDLALLAQRSDRERRRARVGGARRCDGEPVAGRARRRRPRGALASHLVAGPRRSVAGRDRALRRRGHASPGR